ncbi:MAG TPA: sugar kinase [Candidatus Angelobacter sp.]|nr:sugar kinase [Candidatus Angelobacter sp.]
MDVITFGETMVLFSANQVLPLEYVHQLSKQFGGAESNVAIGLARQGHSSGWFSKLGQDPFGTFIQRAIRGEGVDTSRCLFTDQAPTGLFFKEKRTADSTNVYYYRKNSAASLLHPEDLDEAYISKAKILHLTGITPALSQTSRETIFKSIEIAKRHNVKISFDPNIRLKLWEEDVARKVLLDIAKQADYVLPGIDEGQLLTNEENPEGIAQALHNLGAGTVIVKCGDKGSFYSDQEDKGFVPAFKVKTVIDPVGAGDGFASGFLSGLLNGETLYDSVKRGNAVGALVVQVNGDIEGLPTKHEVDHFMEAGDEPADVKR